MKLSRIFVSLLVAIGVVAVAAADDPLLRGERPHYKPRRNDFKQIKVFYDPKEESGKKCGLYYQIEGKEGILIYFDNDEIDESSDKVVCEKKQEATGGVKLPLNEDLDLDYAFWKGEVPRDADVRWRGDNLYVQIKKITEWEARYDPDGPKDKKCYLQYKYKTDETTKVYFRDDYVNESGDDKVVCKRKVGWRFVTTIAPFSGSANTDFYLLLCRTLTTSQKVFPKYTRILPMNLSGKANR